MACQAEILDWQAQKAFCFNMRIVAGYATDKSIDQRQTAFAIRRGWQTYGMITIAVSVLMAAEAELIWRHQQRSFGTGLPRSIGSMAVSTRFVTFFSCNAAEGQQAYENKVQIYRRFLANQQ